MRKHIIHSVDFDSHEPNFPTVCTQIDLDRVIALVSPRTTSIMVHRVSTEVKVFSVIVAGKEVPLHFYYALGGGGVDPQMGDFQYAKLTHAWEATLSDKPLGSAKAVQPQPILGQDAITPHGMGLVIKVDEVARRIHVRHHANSVVTWFDAENVELIDPR